MTRINNYYQYLFGSRIDSSSAIRSLPPQLNIQLLVATHMRTLSKVPFFKVCDYYYAPSPAPCCLHLPPSTSASPLLRNRIATFAR